MTQAEIKNMRSYYNRLIGEQMNDFEAIDILSQRYQERAEELRRLDEVINEECTKLQKQVA